MEIAIIGLPKSGKTTVFNALTRGKAQTSPYASAALAPNLGVVKVPDPRLNTLAKLLKPRKVTPAEVRYVDIGVSLKGLGGELLTHLSRADALFHVVRAFRDEAIPHAEGSVDAARDIATMDMELVFSDLAILEKRLQRIEVSLRGAKPGERDIYVHEQALLGRIRKNLEADVPLREQSLSPEEIKSIENYQFLTAKPLLLVVNIGEDDLPQSVGLEAQLRSSLARPHREVVALCGKLESELAQLEDAEAAEFRSAMGLTEPGVDRVIRASYKLLGLVAFFTIASDELRAWTIRSNTPAVKAAGKIHSDMEKGFIRAETIAYGDLMKCGSLAEARKRGLLRLEGKSYIVQDGDILTILFNI